VTNYLAILMAAALLASLLFNTGSGQEARVEPLVFLNHFYLTLDHATYLAIENNQFLRREFAATEQRTTVRKDRTYTGLYFYGTNTYFEFFDAEQETRRRVGDSAIAFGVDEAGASAKLESRLGTHSVTITRQLGTVDIPWFYQTMPKGFSLESGISTWVMEYHPRFLPEWHAETGGPAGITRKEVLQRYKAVLKDVPAKPYLADVVRITMAADKQVSAQMSELCKAFGYALRTDGENTVLQGPDSELRLVSGTESIRGIRQVSLRVSRTQGSDTELRFGPKSVLKVHLGGTATWAF